MIDKKIEIEKFVEIEQRIRAINDKNGWLFPSSDWLAEENTYFIPTKLMLIVSEVSEALEAFRVFDYENFKEELADIMIRLLDLTTSLKIDILEEIDKKLKINEGRGFKHGNKRV